MIVTTDHGPIRELQLARPPVNALSPDLISALEKAVADAPGKGAEAIVLSGAPGMFSAGLDVPHFLTLDRDGVTDAWRRFLSLLGTLAACPVPLAAALTGHSPAGGAVVSMFCDYRVMADGPFKIGFNEVQVGIVLPASFQLAIRRLVGRRHAERLSTGALLISPQEARAIDLVDELAPVEETVPRALEWCRSLLALPREAMLTTRRNARGPLIEAFESFPEHELEALVDRWCSDETQGALRAMVERVSGKKNT